MCQQPSPLIGCGVVFASVKKDVFADCIGIGTQLSCGFPCLRVAVNADNTEVLAEPLLHVYSHGRLQRLPWSLPLEHRLDVRPLRLAACRARPPAGTLRLDNASCRIRGCLRSTGSLALSGTRDI